MFNMLVCAFWTLSQVSVHVGFGRFFPLSLSLHRVFSFKWKKILNFLAATHQVWNCSFPCAYDGIALSTDRERYWFVLDDMIQDIDSIIIEQTRLDTKIWKQFIECLLHIALRYKDGNRMWHSAISTTQITCSIDKNKYWISIGKY